jgi:prolyl oligopeptidase
LDDHFLYYSNIKVILLKEVMMFVKRGILHIALLLYLFIGCEQQTVQRPPVAPVRNVVDEYYGVKVDDPYRYMENLDNPEVQSWIKDQADYASSILGQIPGRDILFEHLKELDAGKPYRIYGTIRFKDGTMFFQKRMADENIAKLYMRDKPDAEDKLLLDPQSLPTEDQQHYSIYFYTPSPNKRYMVYGLAKGGSEQTTLYTMDLESGQVLPETIDQIETAYNKPRWLPDGSGFFYCRRQELPDDAPATEIYKNTKVYFHKIGTEVDKDLLIAGRGISSLVPLEEVDFPSFYIPHASQYAILKIKHGDARELTLYTAPIKTLLNKDIPWKKICDVPEGVDDYDVHGNHIYLLSSQNAPRFKVVHVSLENPNFEAAKVVVAPGDKVVESVNAAKDALYVGVLDAGFNRILRVPYSNLDNAQFLNLPNNAAGYIASISNEIDGALVYATSWTKGSIIYAYDPSNDTFSDSELLPKGKYDDLEGYTSKEVKVESYDGTMVPLSIIHKTGIQLNGQNPTLMTGYGAYGFAQNVFFSALNIAWLERGGVFAVAHVRGGGEYGKEWHLAGQKLTKPNTWKDFIACAEYLIEQGYTSKERIAGQGGSAGGILIGRAITDRPDLFAAAIINVGSLDAVRFETTTNGVPNIPEFGTVKKEDEFHALLEMSSYHHVEDGVAYPAVLLTHGINDPRVDPWMSAKMTARLQAATASTKPVIFRVDYAAGHGIGSTRDQYLQQRADEMAFLLWQFGIPIQ